MQCGWMKYSCQFISSVSALLPTKRGIHLSLLASKYDLHKLGSFCGLTLGISYQLLAVMRNSVSQVLVCFCNHFKQQYDEGALCIVRFGSAACHWNVWGFTPLSCGLFCYHFVRCHGGIMQNISSPEACRWRFVSVEVYTVRCCMWHFRGQLVCSGNIFLEQWLWGTFADSAVVEQHKPK